MNTWSNLGGGVGGGRLGKSKLIYSMMENMWIELNLGLFFKQFFLLSSILQYYIEPGTGFRFRSRLAAERYLQEVRKSKSTTNAKEGNLLAVSLICKFFISVKLWIFPFLKVLFRVTLLSFITPLWLSAEKYFWLGPSTENHWEATKRCQKD